MLYNPFAHEMPKLLTICITILSVDGIILICHHFLIRCPDNKNPRYLRPVSDSGTSVVKKFGVHIIRQNATIC